MVVPKSLHEIIINMTGMIVFRTFPSIAVLKIMQLDGQ